mgnify:CR=1 FL=1
MEYETWHLIKGLCKQCAHCVTETDPKQDKPDTIMRCSATPSKRRGSPHQYCNYARDPGEACGPDATFFQPRTE